MKITHLILGAVIAAGLAGCGTVAPLQPAPAKPVVITGFATLASAGTFEFDTAPTFNRLSQARYNAARLLDSKRISVQLAKAVQVRANYARAMLDEALRIHKDAPITARELLDQAGREVAACEQLLKGKS